MQSITPVKNFTANTMLPINENSNASHTHDVKHTYILFWPKGKFSSLKGISPVTHSQASLLTKQPAQLYNTGNLDLTLHFTEPLDTYLCTCNQQSTGSHLTLPYLENTCLRSVARVDEDSPLTQRLRLLPLVAPPTHFPFLSTGTQEHT
jgi:hypothetical protein